MHEPKQEPLSSSKLEKLLRQTAGELRDLRGDYSELLQTVRTLAAAQQQTQQELARLTHLLEVRSSQEPVQALAPDEQISVRPILPAQPSQPVVDLSSETEAASVYWQRRGQALREYQPIALRPSEQTGAFSLERAADGQQLYFGFMLPKQRFAVLPDLERHYSTRQRQQAGLEQLFLLKWASPGSEPGRIRELTRAAVMIQEAGRWLLIQKGQLTLEPGS